MYMLNLTTAKLVKKIWIIWDIIQITNIKMLAEIFKDNMQSDFKPFVQKPRYFIRFFIRFEMEN